MRLLRFAFALALLAAGAACVHRSALNTYRLTRQDNAAILVPPASPRLADIPPGTGHCAEEGGIELQPAGKKLRVTVDRGALLNQREPGWLAGWSIRAEAAGCIPAGRGAELAEWIVESTPMDTAAATRLLYPGVISGGYVELGPWSRLEVHSPILREGTPVDAPVIDAMKVTGHGYNIDVDSSLAPSVIGFETAWYGVERNAGGIGYHFEPLSVERNIQGAVARGPAPAADYFQFPPEARFFRLFHKSEDNDVLAYLIALGPAAASVSTASHVNSGGGSLRHCSCTHAEYSAPSARKLTSGPVSRSTTRFTGQSPPCISHSWQCPSADP